MLYGTQLDHTILLASYFLHLNIKYWVAIGFGLPRGSSSYVLIQYDVKTNRIVQRDDVLKSGFFVKNEHVLYACDAACGHAWDVRDDACPMKTVQYVFDDRNVSYVRARVGVGGEHGPHPDVLDVKKKGAFWPTRFSKRNTQGPLLTWVNLKLGT